MECNRVGQVSAWGVLLLLVAVPPFVVVAVGQPNALWILWTAISIWSTLDAAHIAAAAFPKRRLHHSPTWVIVGLAVLNLLVSLWAILAPTALRAAGR